MTVVYVVQPGDRVVMMPDGITVHPRTERPFILWSNGIRQTVQHGECINFTVDPAVFHIKELGNA